MTANQTLPVYQDLFPKPLMIATATYAYQVLSYMQRRPELEMQAIGNKALYYLQNIRHVKSGFSASYYQYLSGIVRQLLKYSSLEESCSMSGAYTQDRLLTVSLIKETLLKFDALEEAGTREYLDLMLEIPQAVS